MTDVRVGLVGCGRVAALHLGALAHVDGVTAAAVTDVDGAQARTFATRFGIDRVHDDTSALAADVDLVAVCSPPRTHAASAVTALQAGRHVLVEKPLVLDLDEADAIAGAATAAAGAVLAVGFNLRLHRQVVAARRALAGGRLGRLLMVRSHWTAAPRPPGWRASGADGGGVLWEMGIHHVDLWRHLTGAEPVDVRATGDDDAVALSARTPDGTLLATTIAAGTSDANDVELVGERGRLTLTLFRGDGPVWAPAGVAGGGIGARLRESARAAATLPRQARAARRGGDYLMSFAAEWAALRDAIRTGAPPHATLADGRAAVALVLAAQDALDQGRAAQVAP